MIIKKTVLFLLSASSFSTSNAAQEEGVASEPLVLSQKIIDFVAVTSGFDHRLYKELTPSDVPYQPGLSEDGRFLATEKDRKIIVTEVATGAVVYEKDIPVPDEIAQLLELCFEHKDKRLSLGIPRTKIDEHYHSKKRKLEALSFALNKNGSRLLIALPHVESKFESKKTIFHLEIIDLATKESLIALGCQSDIKACIFNPENPDELVLSEQGFRTKGKRGLVACPMVTFFDIKTRKKVFTKSFL